MAAVQASKKVVVFGGTGKTGLHVVQQALDRGHHVTVIARSPEKMTIKNDNLVVVKGDIFDIESFSPSFEGKDAILSTFGTAFHSIFNPTTEYSESMKGILQTMKKVLRCNFWRLQNNFRYKSYRHGVNRLIVETSWGTEATPGGPFSLEWIIKPLLLNGMLKDMGVMEHMIEKEEGINYTIVRPAGLTNDPPNGKYKIEEGVYCNKTGTTHRIPRADVAACMLNCLDTDQYDKKGIAIATLIEPS
ncbi:flavin reductase (NADPH) isoform X1 [Nematostella vectensis]|uniref:flavin reductase (NADPH) isoform X1 n=1 Tax=Nematostella vectensis TaxID=45351 RepID=UPI0020770182|nr:flavin reductase (NADPH) isoform X1 [Nematostella vectensis]